VLAPFELLVTSATCRLIKFWHDIPLGPTGLGPDENPVWLYGVVSVRGDLKEFSEFDRIWVWFFMEAYLQMVIFTEKKELQKPSNWGTPK
jgi:hypothetical protein